MSHVRRLTSSEVRRCFKSAMDYVTRGGVVLIETTKAQHPRAVIISIEQAQEAGIIPKEQE